MLETRLRSALLETMVRDHIFVDSSSHVYDTARMIGKVCQMIRSNEFNSNNVVVSTNKNTNHSQIISIRKKDIVKEDPTLCFQMMLMCIDGLGEKVARAIIGVYPSMPKLLGAYERCGHSVEEKEGLLKDIVMNNKNKRRIGIAKSTNVYHALFFVTE